MKKLIFFVSLVGMLVSCVSVKHVSFERLQAADLNFPEQVRRVGVINRVPIMPDTLSNTDIWKGTMEGNGRMATEIFAEEVAETRYFDQVIICDSAMRKQGDHPEENPFLSVTEIDSLSHILDVDVLLVMERVCLQLNDVVVYIPELMENVPSVDVVVTPVIRVYKEEREMPLFALSESDTLCWMKSPGLTLQEMVEKSSEHAARMLINYLLPTWKEVHRYYYDGGHVDMRDAGVYVREENWDAAATLWKSVYDHKKGKQKMYAAFNLALYHELQNEFSQALRYLNEAESLSGTDSDSRNLIRYFQQQLQQQEKQNQKLQIQMKRFE